MILFDADKLDVIGAIGVARTIAFDVVVNQQIYAEPSPKFLESGVKEAGEPHSSYHEYLYKLSNARIINIIIKFPVVMACSKR